MGIINCTPDSFSDGGLYLAVDNAISRGERLLNEGAAILDIGGESTRPGSTPVAADEECGRVLPVIAELRARRPGSLLSIDTSKAEVARQALAAGADIVNDVTGASDPAMLDNVAEADSGIVLMHMRGQPRTMQDDTSYGHVVAEVHEYLRRRAEAAVSAGIRPTRIWLDSGIGFGKDDDGNLALLAAVPDLATLGYPIVIGASNKTFIGRLTGAPVDQRLAGSLAALTTAIAVERVIVRVHRVAETRQFLEIASAVREAVA
jgi:dihydropteroate synthase